VRRALAALTVAAAFLLLPAIASAHPLGNFTVNRYAGIVMTPGEVRVDHVVDMAEIPTIQVTREIDTDADGILSDAERSAWAASTAHELAANLFLTVDGERIALEVVSAAVELGPGQGGLDVLRLESTFAAAVADAGELRFRDGNFADRVGWQEVTATGMDGTALVRSSVPARSVSDRLLAYPHDPLSSPLDVREAAVTFEPGAGAPVGGDGPASSGRPGATGGGFAELAAGGSPMFLALLLAFAFGALHALGPGHGKTLMAAYLVGAGGRARQAVAVGGAVAVMHTASVLALGVVVLGAKELFAPERVYPWLGLGSGLIAFGLGAALLVARLGAWGTRTDRVVDGDPGHDVEHEPHEHHGHSHPHTHPVPEGVLSRRGIAALAVAGGILPSPTALIVLLATLALDRLAYGLGLIAAFSLGLAAALVVVGLVALRARDAVYRRMSSRFARAVPVLSASAIAVVGLVLAMRGFAEI
jgi:ABC-type nickel/cobalt efflux system permease component RcnA